VKYTICLLTFCLGSLASCSSPYFEDFDTPVQEGVKNYSLTDLERSIVEMPGNAQDVLVVVPKQTTSCACTSSQVSYPSKKVWICHQRDCNGNLNHGHYKVFKEETPYAID
jgi:hypothetical protein